MFLRCDGTITMDSMNRPSCTNWVAVTEQELLMDSLAAHRLSQADYELLAGWTIAMLATAFTVRLISKLIVNR